MGAIRSGKTLISKTLSGIDLTGIRARVFDAENQVFNEKGFVKTTPFRSWAI